MRTVSGPTLAVTLPAGAHGVADLKRVLLAREGVSPQHQVLTAAGRVLRDDASLAEAGLADGASVALTFSLCGAGNCG